MTDMDDPHGDEGLGSGQAGADMAVGGDQRVGDPLARARLEGQEKERARWARELHDSTLQALAAVQWLLDGALVKGPETLPRTAEEASGLLGIEITNLRRLVNELRPSALDDLGIPGALESLAARVVAGGGPTVTTTVALAGRLDREVELDIFRVVQEAITNAIKHSHAAAVKVEVVAQGERLMVSVADDGVGFDTTTPTGGLGLLGIRERAHLLGANLEVCSSSSSGTKIRLSLPIRSGL